MRCISCAALGDYYQVILGTLLHRQVAKLFDLLNRQVAKLFDMSPTRISHPQTLALGLASNDLCHARVLGELQLNQLHIMSCEHDAIL